MYNIHLINMPTAVVTTATPITLPEIAINKVDDPEEGYTAIEGYLSLDITFTGSGTLAATLLVSNGDSFVAYEGALPIFSGKAAGQVFSPFSIPVCRAFKIVLTATAATCTVTKCTVALA